jgi:N-acetylmuramic acid 6-phosphate etherase
MVQGIIAGGDPAVFQAQEGAEDSFDNGANEIMKRSVNPPDVVVGLAASGRTPFVKGALQEANKRGCYTVLITTVSQEQAEELGVIADTKICPNVGAEVIMGSTRMKSGTAQKLVLNMLSTASMIKLGKTYGNVMVDLQLTNKKLEERAKRIVMSLSGVSYDEAANYLNAAQGNVKTALVMIFGDCSQADAKDVISKAKGHVKQAIKLLNNKPTK